MPIVGALDIATLQAAIGEAQQLVQYITIDDPNAATGSGSMTVANGINDKGQIVGFYLDPNGNTDGMLGPEPE